jgi:hypothetical protein
MLITSSQYSANDRFVPVAPANPSPYTDTSGLAHKYFNEIITYLYQNYIIDICNKMYSTKYMRMREYKGACLKYTAIVDNIT